MSDAAEVLAAVFERLEASEMGRAMVRAVFGCHVREQLHCYNCSRDTHQSAYCQYLYNASAAGIRAQGVDMQHDFNGFPPLVSSMHPWEACMREAHTWPCQTITGTAKQLKVHNPEAGGRLLMLATDCEIASVSTA